ncbi:MAG TPA: FG-GAP-like repeat-containing protein [Rhodothermales bacterium]|nr:FG-GAP-like repeat-containing protein [Rhodothermales bacterium]
MVLLLAGCGARGAGEPEETDTAVVQTEGTRNMVRELDRLYQETLANPRAYYYLNQERAALIREQAASATGAVRSRMLQAYASELLNGGDTEDAIAQIQRLLDELGGSSLPLTQRSKALYELLGIAYLRLGEQQNCLANYTDQSCILPLQNEAIHRLPNGSLHAIDVYTRLLSRYRADYQSRWLLNLAYMTLGQYPDGVPAEFLIPGLRGNPKSEFPRFQNVAGALGLDLNGLAGGAAVEDFNNDGFLDVFTTANRLNDEAWLFLNDGRGGFVDHTEQAGLTGISGGLNLVDADYNNDGYVDVLILRGGWLGASGRHPNSLLKNNGDGTFQDVTEASGLLSYHPTQTAAWGDFNNDGWLDLFIGNEESDRWLSAWQSASGSQQEAGRNPSELYVNDGDGTFTEVAAQVGIDLDAFVKGVAWGDVNNDGLLDLYVSIMGGPNRLYLNRGAQEPSGWSFEEVGAEAGVHEPFFSFPTWFFDYNNDGWEDIFVGSYDLRRIGDAAGEVAREYLGLPVETEMPKLYRNNGDGTFTDVAEAMGLDKVLFAMGSNFGDLDNDGFLDFYVGTGAPDLRSVIPNRMFHNLGGRRFEEVTFEGGFGHIQKGHAVAFGDMDQDGDQDIYASIGGALEGDVFRNALFENPGNSTGNAWVTLQFEGRRSNRSAVGARIKIAVIDTSGARRHIYRTVTTGGSFGASSLQQEIGLGQAERIEDLQITWPNRESTVEHFSDLPVNQYYRVVEGRQKVEQIPKPAVPFRKVGPGSHRHAESPAHAR